MSMTEEKTFIIEDELKKLPKTPGVYLMKDKDGEVIYVGKAVDLQSRVRSYFQKSDKSSRIRRMVESIDSFECVMANDEREAFIMECNLIKSHMPYYNIMMKDDKTYPYIRITTDEEYPRISITRKVEKDKSRYFGPYPERVSAKNAINILQTNFPVRTCKKTKMGQDKRPCLNYHIKRCLGPCASLCTKEEYMEQVAGLLRFLEGKSPEILEEFKVKMEEASKEQRYETAAVFRDRINTLRKASDLYMVKPGMKRTDIVAVASKGSLAVAYVLNINEGAVIDRRQFEFSSIGSGNEITENFLRQYYSGGNAIPNELLVYNPLENPEWLSEWLGSIKGQTVHIRIPKQGEKRKLAELAYSNAFHVLQSYEERLLSDSRNLVDLAKLLKLEEFPHRIEAYDISNLAGSDTVGSMVVFIDGKPRRSMYRKFSIKTEASGNDLAAMAEVLSRRLARFDDETFGGQPELIMIDGGINQVNAVLSVLSDTGYEIPVCGMVKDDRHITKALVYMGKTVNLAPTESLFRFVASIQNEAHRFAIEFNRKKRKKRYFDSELDKIPGIGSKRKESLMRHFGSIREIKAAGITQIEEVNGISSSTAAGIYEYFHGKAGK
ncbi:MAG: excinuclease ABC subunit UvrC [Clostridia bacterium]|nr:excinuclease ABC subunit UvrC [Clostridia bacterium]